MKNLILTVLTFLTFISCATVPSKSLNAENFRLKKIRANSLITCEIKFIVEKDGTLSNITAIGENESFNKEAIRAVTKIKEKWIPATINGQAVSERFKIPLTINFE